MRHAQGMERGLLRVCVICIVGLALLLSSNGWGAVSAHYNSIVVNTHEDLSPANDGLCTLREAVIAANTGRRSGHKTGECVPSRTANTIVLSPGVYNLTRTDSGYEDAAATGDLDIRRSLTVRPASPGLVVIQWQEPASAADRLFHVVSGKLTLQQVTLRGGAARQKGGALYVNYGATAQLENVTLSGNRAAGVGGAIYNKGTLKLINVTLGDSTPSGPSALVTAYGGHIFERNTLNLDKDSHTGVTPQFDASGRVTVYTLSAGSSALDAGTNDGCPAVDQLGVARPQGDRCDLGAIELDNRAPVATPQRITTAEDTPILVTLQASDADGDPLTFAVVDFPLHGALTGDAPNLLYTPDADFNGTDSFTFKVNDGQTDSAPALLQITVQPVNDAPVAVSDAVSAAEDQPTVLPPSLLLANDTDIDSPSLAIVAFTQPAHGQLTLAENGDLRYTPNRHFDGVDSFSYTASDGEHSSAPATVTLTVAPDAYLEVTNFCDSGPGSLRAALDIANSTPAADTVIFDFIDGRCDGPAIALQSPLPALTAPLEIDGSLRDDGAAPTMPVVLDGSAVADGDGLVFTGDAGGSTLRAVTIQNFGGSGVVIRQTSHITVTGNTVTGNGGAGVLVLDGEGNLITANSFTGNGGPAIDLDGDGPSPNDLGDVDLGANLGQNYPEIYQAFPSPGALILNGVLNSLPGVYDVRFYVSASCDDAPQTLLNAQPFLVTIDPNQSAVYNSSAYFSARFEMTGPAQFLGQVVRVTASDAHRNTSELSPCTRIDQNNDAWNRAQFLALTPRQTPAGDAVLSASVEQFIDRLGRSRWYKFSVQPNSTVQVTLDNLPANYDLTLYRDIRAAYNALSVPEDNADLARLNAEFAADGFNPDALGPDAFNSAVYSAEGFSAEGFSAEGFSAEVFSAEGFSAEGFSAEGFSAEGFSAEGFSAEGFSAEGFSAEGFSAEGFSAEGFSAEGFSAEGFSSAQIRSLLGISANNGDTQESVRVNTWANDGEFYVRVRGRFGAFDLNQPFRVTVTQDVGQCSLYSGLDELPAATPPSLPAGRRTLILVDTQRMIQRYGVDAVTALVDQLNLLAADPSVDGTLVDLSLDARTVAANLQADAQAACPFLKNVVAQSIQAIVNGYRQDNTTLQYLVIVGNDAVIPFVRYPDSALLAPESNYIPPVADATTSQAALRLNYVLGQDAYGAATAIPYKGSDLPIPDLPVGRLVETPAQILAVIDAYRSAANGVVTPQPGRALVTGYDFLEDAARAIETELVTGLTPAGSTPSAIDTLITPYTVSPNAPTLAEGGQVWTGADLGNLLLNQRHDLVFLAGHFSAGSALAADFRTRLTTLDLAASTVDMRNSLVFSAGCHSGYNLVDGHGLPGITNELDWAQAFAGHGATLIAGTGYQYGDTDFVEYGERLYLNFARQLRTGTGPVAVGDALVAAKQQYLAETPQLVGLHKKSLLQATLFGLPMLRFDLPGQRITPADDPSVVTGLQDVVTNPGVQLGLRYADVSFAPQLEARAVTLDDVNSDATVTATWLTGPDGVQVKPVEPVLPLARVNVAVDNTTLRGVGLRGGVYSDEGSVFPLNGVPATEIRGVHTPFQSTVFFPIQPWSVNYFDALTTGNGGATRLALTPVQHRADGLITSLRRRFAEISLRLFYSSYVDAPGELDGAALSAPPTLVQVESTVNGDNVVFRVLVVGNPAAGIQETWITYTGVAGHPAYGRWTSLDLTQDPTDSRYWVGTLPLSGADPAGIRFIVQATNGVGLTSLSTNFGGYFIPGGEQERTATALALSPLATSVAYGEQLTLSATLRDVSGQALADRLIVFGLGSQSRSGVTDANGTATVTMQVRAVPGVYDVTAQFPGEAVYAASADVTGPVTVTERDTLICIEAPAAAEDSLCSPAQDSVLLVEETPYVVATLTAAPLPNQPILNLSQKEVRFTFVDQNSGVTVVESVITDYAGRAFLDRALPAGTYAVTVSFAGTSVFRPSQSTTSLTLRANNPPLCGVYANPRTIWPPTGKFVHVTLPVTDPDGDPVTITVHSVFQDEPVGKQPDAIVEGGQVQVRAERRGKGDGRVYHIFYSAVDASGAACEGEAKVAVVHDQGANLEAIDGGARYDSLIAERKGRSALDLDEQEMEWGDEAPVAGEFWSFLPLVTGE